MLRLDPSTVGNEERGTVTPVSQRRLELTMLGHAPLLPVLVPWDTAFIHNAVLVLRRLAAEVSASFCMYAFRAYSALS